MSNIFMPNNVKSFGNLKILLSVKATNASFYFIPIIIFSHTGRMVTSARRCEQRSTLYEYSWPKHKYGDFKKLIGLAESLSLDESEGYVLHACVCVCVCVWGFCVCVWCLRVCRRPAKPKSHEFVNNVLCNSQSTPPHHPRLVIRESGRESEKTGEPSLAFLHNQGWQRVEITY